MQPTILRVDLTPEGVAVLWQLGEGPPRLVCAPNWAQAARRIYEQVAPQVQVGIDATSEAWIDIVVEAMRASFRAAGFRPRG